ncbi:hypothetical protein WJX74_008545 [Apatococcus lobatus]|uniref:Helitron helicase-like domain-containing protein n=1 Tax=Apatococcus lobatus TaxID=904363 RepID=A0AAW1QMJ0_9CHLO
MAGINIDQTYARGVSNLRIQGGVYHRIGSLLPSDGDAPKFAQLYIHDGGDSVAELDRRLAIFITDPAHRETVSQLQSMSRIDHERQVVEESAAQPDRILIFDIRRTGKKVTVMNLAAYHLHKRADAPCNNRLLRCNKLFQEWICDNWAKAEGDRLQYLRHNQAQLRAELFQGITDAVATDSNDARAIGKRVVLPSSFIGSPRYMDAMAIVREHGKPDLFVTMTCNPKWPEITHELEPGQQASDRPDLTARVFKIHVIEFQKRGLPHAHLLIILAPESKPRTPEDYDSIVCCEIPDPQTHSKLHATVKSMMMHGPCGPHNPHASCMEGSKCTKGYPKPFVEETQNIQDGYPLYRRRNNGRTVRIERNVPSSAQPQQPQGPVEHDEIADYLDARYVSSSEACWRLPGFGLNDRDPTVYRLAVHLPQQQTVHFSDHDRPAAILQRNSETTLTLVVVQNQP